MYKKYFSLNTLSTILLYISILAFTISFNFSDNRSGGWQQQFLPNLNGRTISDITFLDSLTGWAITPYTNINDTAYVLKTTNGGDNWNFANIRSGQFVGYNKIHFLNLNTGFVCGAYQSGVYTCLNKSTNGGTNWFNINAPAINSLDMFVLNEDTIWLVDRDGLVGGVYLTTNGGASWTRQLNLGTLNPENIYMYNKDIGFISRQNSYVRKTTDGGQSWFVVVNNQGFSDIHFFDSLTGMRSRGNNMYKTIDGGYNWTVQLLPSGNNFLWTGLSQFSCINRDTIWGAGGTIILNSGGFRGIIPVTTNGGINWGYQIPDTSINIFQYVNINSIDRLNVWAYAGVTGVHTTLGGDTTFYTGIQQSVGVIPKDYFLKQNYPNPFNPRTIIPFSLKKNAFVKLIAYDIRGIEVQRLAEGRYNAGEYEVDFMGKFSSSGVYFYKIEITTDNSNEIYKDTKRMILLK